MSSRRPVRMHLPQATTPFVRAGRSRWPRRKAGDDAGDGEGRGAGHPQHDGPCPVPERTFRRSQVRHERRGAMMRARVLGLGSNSTVTNPAMFSRSGTPCRFSMASTGSKEPTERLDAHAVRTVVAVTTTPESSASITTGQPPTVPVSRPATIILGMYPCPSCGSSSFRGAPTRHARPMGRCRWES